MIDAWIFVHRTNMAVILDLKGFLINQNYFYQHQNIAIIIEGDSETCTISEFRMIILFLKFIGSFQVAAFSFPNLFFLPSRFSLLSSGHSLCCLPQFASTTSRKPRAAKKFLSALCAMRHG